MFWTLARKVSFALAAILLSTMVLTALFGYFKFTDVLSAQVGSRYGFVVFTIKKRVEDSLNLGLALRQLRQAQETIEREKVGDSTIIGIEIFDARGEILFDTDRGAIGTYVPEEWLDGLAGAATQTFSRVDDDMQVVGLPLVNTLGKVEGAVALRYPAAYIEQQTGHLLGTLAVEWAVVVAVFAVIAVVGALWMFRPVGRRLGAMEAVLVRGMAEPGGPVSQPGLDDPFEVRFSEFLSKTREAADHLRDATQEVERLDRLA
ncbi:MAG: hypothetical protein ACM30I_03090 [Gemmatimonas sp.]